MDFNDFRFIFGYAVGFFVCYALDLCARKKNEKVMRKFVRESTEVYLRLAQAYAIDNKDFVVNQDLVDLVEKWSE